MKTFQIFVTLLMMLRHQMVKAQTEYLCGSNSTDCGTGGCYDHEGELGFGSFRCTCTKEVCSEASCNAVLTSNIGGWTDTCPDYCNATACAQANDPGDSDDDGDGEVCFSGNMEVVVQGKGVVPMEALQVGDYVKIGSGEVFEQVYAFGHRVPQKYAEFVQLHTNAGTPLEMTGEHLVFVDGKTNPVRADSIKVGDVLQAEGNNGVVEKIELVTRNGIYNPLTISGTIQVNGIAASSYIAFQKENNEYAEFQGGIEVMSHHDAAHIAMTPYRFYCTALATCDINDASSSMPVYVSMGIELIQWSKQQHILVQLFTYASFRMLLLASILMACAVLMIPAYLLLNSSIFQMQRVVSYISTIGVSINKGLKMKKEN